MESTPIICTGCFFPSLINMLPEWGMKSPHIPTQKGKNEQKKVQKCEIKKIRIDSKPILCTASFFPSLIKILPKWGMKTPHIPTKKAKMRHKWVKKCEIKR